MKKYLVLLLFIIIGTSAFAQTYRYRAYDYAFGERNSYGRIVWGDWEDTNVLITIDFDNDYIKVYSERKQNYVIVDAGEEYYDDNGGTNIDFEAIDEEGIECTVRLRIQSDGVAQLYSYYSDIAWVYGSLTLID